MLASKGDRENNLVKVISTEIYILEYILSQKAITMTRNIYYCCALERKCHCVPGIFQEVEIAPAQGGGPVHHPLG